MKGTPRSRGAGPLDGRAYYAYLLPQSATQAGFGMIDAPTIPEGSIRLGVLVISAPFDPKRYEGQYARASLTFTVPDVPTGDYAIGFCDDPCQHGYVGWLAWGSIRIVHTARGGDSSPRSTVRSSRPGRSGTISAAPSMRWKICGPSSTRFARTCGSSG